MATQQRELTGFQHIIALKESERCEFIKEQVRVAGINPQKLHFWGIEFLDRKFAVMLEALQHHINEKFPITSSEKRIEFEQKVGFLPMFPVPN